MSGSVRAVRSDPHPHRDQAEPDRGDDAKTSSAATRRPKPLRLFPTVLGIPGEAKEKPTFVLSLIRDRSAESTNCPRLNNGAISRVKLAFRWAEQRAESFHCHPLVIVRRALVLLIIELACAKPFSCAPLQL